jgi:cell division protein FtsB
MSWPPTGRTHLRVQPLTSKRHQTMSKMARERTVKERRARKLEKKYAAAAERKERDASISAPQPDAGSA